MEATVLILFVAICVLSVVVYLQKSKIADDQLAKKNLENELSQVRSEVQQQTEGHIERIRSLEVSKSEGDESYQAEVKKIQSDLEKVVLQANLLSDKLRKTEADNDSLHDAIEKITSLYVTDNLDFICSKVTASNYESSRRKLEKVFSNCAKNNIEFPSSDTEPFFHKLRDAFKEAVRQQEIREEQARIKEQIRDEQRAQAEYEAEINRLQQQEQAIQAALREAMQKSNDQHSEEIERLQAELAAALESKERAISQAQLTKVGHIYVISNIGSFGERVYKVGMTRRHRYQDRIEELGDASVPFPFDVHAVVKSDDAPKLESALHKELHSFRVNKINLRKEFFRTDLDTIVSAVEKHHGKTEYVASPEAQQYFETLRLIERGADDLESLVENDEKAA